MTVCANIKRPVFKGFTTIWPLLTEESSPPEESESSHYLFEKCDKIRDLRVLQNFLKRARYRLIYFYNF